ncbi:MAG: DUF2752 domain-containing protein [Deltaproteobacteria bacterium]|nr:DUF2752 domain-containing protein [Deltaproteobacteria bacterium]
MARLNHSDGRIEHLYILALSAAAVFGSFLLNLSPTGTPYISAPWSDTPLHLSETCFSRRVLGISCPGCGLTRSFVAVAHGQIQSAFRYNLMGPVLYLVCLLQIPYRWIEYRGVWRDSPLWLAVCKRFDWITWILVAGLVVAWLLRTAFGLLA